MPLSIREKENRAGQIPSLTELGGGARPGNALFVPPPPDQVLECLGALEKFLHNDPVSKASTVRTRRSHLLWIQASLSATLSSQPMDPRTAQFYAGHAHELARRYIAAGSASPHLDPARRTRDRS
jgi:hypothetical protein